MTRVSIGRFGLIGAGVMLLTSMAFASAVVADHRLAVNAVTSSITEADGRATVKFVVEVTNQDEAAMTDLRVVFSEDYQVAVGTVAPDAKAASAAQEATFDMASVPTKTVAVPVTLKFSVDGAAVEMPWVLNFGRRQ